MPMRSSIDRSPSPLPASMQKFTLRDLRWLWSFLDQWYGNDLWQGIQPQPYSNFSDIQRVRMMADAIKRNQNPESFEKSIIIARKNAIIPDEITAWIDRDNQRQLIWAIFNLGNPFTLPFQSTPASPARFINSQFNPPEMPLIQTTHVELRYDSIIAALDKWPHNLDYKIEFILNKKKEWAALIEKDSRTNWIDKRNSEQLSWAFNYLQSQGYKNIPTPTNDSECYGAVMSAFDSMAYYQHPAERTLFIEKMKKTWSQKKYRDSGNAKKPYYLPLSLKTRERLDWLAENYGCKPSEVLEKLISERHAELKK